MNPVKVNNAITEQVRQAVAKKLAEKRGYKKRVKVAVDRIKREISRWAFQSSKYEVKRCEHSSRFGCDELGRDVEDGLYKYVRLLKARHLQIHTVVVLGSRAKGSWTSGSDTDVLVVASNLPREGNSVLTRRLLEIRRRSLLSDRPLFLGIEPSGCCSKSEFLTRLKSFDIQALDAILCGQIVYDDGFWTHAQDSYEKMRKDYLFPESELRRILQPL